MIEAMVNDLWLRKYQPYKPNSRFFDTTYSDSHSSETIPADLVVQIAYSAYGATVFLKPENRGMSFLRRGVPRWSPNGPTEVIWGARVIEGSD